MRNMLPVLAAILLAIAPACRADAIDDAEAKARGVSIETIQNERLQTQVTDLQKQVTDLLQKNQQLQAKLADAIKQLQSLVIAQKAATAIAATQATAATQPETIASKFPNDHVPHVGMTLEEARQAVGKNAPVFLQNESTAGKSYTIGAAGYHINYDITVDNDGKVTMVIVDH